jgi:hypothetical protein
MINIKDYLYKYRTIIRKKSLSLMNKDKISYIKARSIILKIYKNKYKLQEKEKEEEVIKGKYINTKKKISKLMQIILPIPTKLITFLKYNKNIKIFNDFKKQQNKNKYKKIISIGNKLFNNINYIIKIISNIDNTNTKLINPITSKLHINLSKQLIYLIINNQSLIEINKFTFNPNYRYIILPLDILINKNSRHANIILIDNFTKLIYHYEPHGIADYNKNNIIISLLEKIFSKDYIIKSEQYFNNIKGIQSNLPFCALYSLFHIITYILNNNIINKQYLNNEIIKLSNNKDYIYYFIYYITLFYEKNLKNNK